MNLPFVKTYMLWLFFAAALCGFGDACLSNAFAATTAEARLAKTMREISAVRSRLNQDEGTLKAEQSKLEELETRYVEQIRQLNELSQQQNETEVKLEKLRQEHIKKTEELSAHQRLLAQQLVSAYQRGHYDVVKLLLSQHSIHSVRRQLTYYHYLNRGRLTAINEAVSHLEQLQQLEKQIQLQTKEIARLLRQAEEEKKELKATRQLRGELVEQAAKRINTHEARLHQLIKDKEKLESLVKELQNLFADIPAEIDEKRSFAQLKGLLPWPINQAKRQSQHSNGILIYQAEGTPVHAIASGRVIFSDWFRGLGFLIIIDHGKNYMSLYGHNQSLLAGLGQWVRQGEPIANLGQSGGAAEPALYFEIRANGKPEIPSYWCRSSKNDR